MYVNLLIMLQNQMVDENIVKLEVKRCVYITALVHTSLHMRTSQIEGRSVFPCGRGILSGEETVRATNGRVVT